MKSALFPRLWLVCVCVALLIVGCGLFTKPADKVSFQRGEAWEAYSNMRVVYAVLKIGVQAACTSGKLDAATCAPLPRIHEEMMEVDGEVMAGLKNPEREVDWVKVGRALAIIAKLAKLGMAL